MTTAAFIGDSYTEGTGAIDAAHAYCFTTGARLGWTVTAYGASKGWGYIGEGPPVSAFGTYLDSVLATNPDVIVMEGGYHDANGSVPLGDVQTAAAALFARMAAVPRVIVLGPTWGTSGGRNKAFVAPYIAPIRAAAMAAGREFIDLTNLWVTGTGKATAPTGDGNADVYTWSDGLHPTQAGHNYLGTRLAFAIRPPSTGLDY